MPNTEERQRDTPPADQAEGTAESETQQTQDASANVRDVIGRRGYDEPEDETQTETEEH